MEKMAYFHFAMATNTRQLARLKVGFLIREILERFIMKKDSTLSPNRSIWIYSAHDSTIASLLNSLGLFEVKTIFIIQIQKIILRIHRFVSRFPTYRTMHLVCFSNCINPMAHFMLKFTINVSLVRTKCHWNL